MNAPGHCWWPLATGAAFWPAGAANTAERGNLAGLVLPALLAINPGAAVYGGAALPPGMGQYGPTTPYGSPLMSRPPGMGNVSTSRTAQTQRDVLRTLLPEIEAAAEARSQKEFERQMAAKGIRTNIDTRAAMQQAAQRAGLQAGLRALQQAGSALTSQYQYQ